MKINSISFKASYIKPADILLKPTIPNEAKENIKGSFVELNPYNENDLNAACELNDYWGFMETYAFQIFDSMERINRRFLCYNENSKFYAITLQKNEFDNIDHKKILGITEIVESDDKISIKFLQVDPMNKWGEPFAKFKHIGTAIIDSLKSIYKKSSIELRSTNSAMKFYKAIGFTKKALKSSDFIYTPKTVK